MKLELNIAKLKEGVQLIERVAGKHATLPVLSCILIEAGKDTLLLKATNLDIGIEVSLPAKVAEAGTIAVPAHILSSFISQISDKGGVITLETSSGNLLVSSSKSKGTIKTLPSDDFPTIPRITDGEEFSLPAESFIKGLKSVWYSASISSVKPELSSVYIYHAADSLTFVATDSFRLAEKKVKVPSSVALPEILLPLKNIPDIIRILETAGDAVDMKVSKNLISFQNEGTYLVSRIINGTFPDYRQIIPKTHTTEVVALKQDIVNGLKISNIFSDKFNQVRLAVDPKGKKFEVSTKNGDIGENKTTIDAALTGESMEVNFNNRYIADCFQSIDADSVSLQMGGANRPMIIKPVSGDQTFLYLVMPMNR